MLRILCIAHNLPHDPTTGGGQRTALLMRALSHFGKTDLINVARYSPVHPAVMEDCRKKYNLLAAVQPLPRGHYKPWKFVRRLKPSLVDRMARVAGTQTIMYRVDPNVRNVVRKAMAENHYDVIVGRFLYPTAMAGLLEDPVDVPILIDLDDVDHIVVREATHRSIPFMRRALNSLHRPQIERVVPPLMNAAAHLWVAAESDAREFEPGRCSILPNIPYSESDDPIEPCPPADHSKDILVVASVGYKPNAEGIDHFIRKCWPAIHQAVPNATFRIVGQGAGEALRARWAATPDVHLVGFVQDLREEYARAAFCIVPVQRGGGTKIKAIECFAYGRTCVVTPHSHRGIEAILNHGESICRADDDASFSQGCIDLLNDVPARNALAVKGHQLVNENYSFQHFRQVIEDSFERLGLLEHSQSPG
jgi:glycosyltransferase involved in cell wall biosynthesis